MPKFDFQILKDAEIMTEHNHDKSIFFRFL